VCSSAPEFCYHHGKSGQPAVAQIEQLHVGAQLSNIVAIREGGAQHVEQLGKPLAALEMAVPSLHLPNAMVTITSRDVRHIAATSQKCLRLRRVWRDMSRRRRRDSRHAFLCLR
jgi:hypothetical protein